jgi:hypothetical protein
MPYFTDRGLIEFCETAQQLPTVLTLLKSGAITQMHAEDIFREHRSKKVKKLDDADIDWDEKKHKDLDYADIDWDEKIASGDIDDLPAKVLKLYLEEHDITVKGKKSDKVEAILEHYDDNQYCDGSDEEVEEEEVEWSEEEEVEEEDAEEEEEVVQQRQLFGVECDLEEIQGVDYGVHEGTAIDIKTATIMGPVGCPVSSTDISKWGPNITLHLKNINQGMAAQ